MSRRIQATRGLLALAATAVLGAAALPATSVAAETTPTCPAGVTYDPSIKSWDQYYADNHNPEAVRKLGQGIGQPGGGPTPGGVGPDPANPIGRNKSDVLLEYADYIVNATASSPRVRVVKKPIGKSSLGKDIAFYVVGTPNNIGNLDGPSGDAAFWRGVRAGDIPEEQGLEAAVTRPAFGWITATPHGNESAAGESIARELYELAARTDCGNVKRLVNTDLFLQLVRNPDGRDAVVRTTAYAFDPNRDFGTRNYVENGEFIPKMNEYPGLYFIDAHQQGGSSYFFPPNEDPVHHEISQFSLDTIQNKIGPSLQRAFNDTSTLYANYSQYDLFSPEYGDTVPSLIMGAAGMTYEKGNAEVYSKQVYDHYLAIDTTINTIANDKIATTRAWVQQWQDAVQQGQSCELQPNKLVSPLHDELTPVPADKRVCGYFFRPGEHTGDVAKLLTEMQQVGVKVFRLDKDTALSGVKEYGKDATDATLPAGTLYIPMAQGMKHWIQAVMGENPFIPYPFYYDIVTWSYGMNRGLAGDGFLVNKDSVPTDMTQIGSPDLGGAPTQAAPVYAFNTDAAKALALVIDLLDQKVKVERATEAFTAADGTRFLSGAALVDGNSLAKAGVDLGALAKKRQTPVSGLSSYPVATKEMTAPKIGLYTGGPAIPANPLYRGTSGNPSLDGHCATSTQANASWFCEALFTLRVKDDLPASAVVPITRTQVENGELVSGKYTALINPNQTIPADIAADPAANPPVAADPSETAAGIRAFINTGGRYIGYGSGANAVTAARNAKISNVGITPIPATMKTPGSTYDATFDTTDPTAWGFERGGWIYRTTSSELMFDPATLGAGNGLGASKSIVNYATDLNSDASLKGQKYGLSVNATGPGLLDGRPAVVGADFGQGRTTLFGWNPFFRAWKDQDERLVLNAALYPTTPTQPARAATRVSPEATADAPVALTAAATQETGAPMPAAKLAAVKTPKQRVKKQHDVARDFQLVVAKKYVAKLKKAVKAAKLPKSLRSKVSYRQTGRKSPVVTFTIENARGEDFHDRHDWVDRLMRQVKKQGVKIKVGQL
jgi:hypothetical protein